MGRNRVQFQKGLSLAEFHERYGTEEKCLSGRSLAARHTVRPA